MLITYGGDSRPDLRDRSVLQSAIAYELSIPALGKGEGFIWPLETAYGKIESIWHADDTLEVRCELMTVGDYTFRVTLPVKCASRTVSVSLDFNDKSLIRLFVANKKIAEQPRRNRPDKV